MPTSRTTYRYWVSYDLGLQGDYDDLYSWLDDKKAKECGDSVATFVSSKTRETIKSELVKLIENDRKPRIYLIDMKTGGGFILGRRKVAPWTGYAGIFLNDGNDK